MKTLFYIPLYLISTLAAFLPRTVFIKVYTPSSAAVKHTDNTLRNAERLTAYKAKKLLGM